MDYDRFVESVAHAASIDRDDAERAVRATLRTLAERIPAAEARQVAAQLPAELGGWLHTKDPPTRFGVEEFLRRVAERAEVDIATAERYAVVVFAVLARAVGRKEFADVESVLPGDFAPLLPFGPDVQIVPAEKILATVAERAGLDAEGARRVTEAVLEVLAERIAPGEVDHLVEMMPFELRVPLRHGKAHSSEQTQRMSADRFVERVAELEGVDPLEARDHVRAVLAALHQVLDEAEFHDITAQLPPEYAAFWVA